MQQYRREGCVYPTHLPKKPRSKLKKKKTVKVVAGGFMYIIKIIQETPRPGAGNENKFSFHESVSFCGRVILHG